MEDTQVLVFTRSIEVAPVHIAEVLHVLDVIYRSKTRLDETVVDVLVVVHKEPVGVTVSPGSDVQTRLPHVVGPVWSLFARVAEVV